MARLPVLALPVAATPSRRSETAPTHFDSREIPVLVLYIDSYVLSSDEIILKTPRHRILGIDRLKSDI